MKKYDKDKPLISIHIPKCAGRSFEKVLEIWFARKLYKHYYNDEINKKPKRYSLMKFFNPSKFKKGICIHGHFSMIKGIGTRDYYPTVDQFITIFRDPFETKVSHYFYCKRLGDSKFISGKKLVMKDQYTDINDYFQKNKGSYILNYMPYDINMGNYKDIIDKYFVYIGIAEDLQTSINILADKLGFPSVKVDQLNKSIKDEEVSEKVREDYINDNDLEYEIYNYVKANYKIWC